MASSKRVNFLSKLSPNSHKYSRGVVGVVAGSSEYPGSAVLCVGGARVGGAGYVHYLAGDNTALNLVLSAYPDIVPASRFDERVEAWIIGPGNPAIHRLPASKYLVLDAAAMALAGESKAEFTVILPHEGEAAHLGFPVSEGIGREAIASLMAKTLKVFVILKGRKTIIASPSGEMLMDEIGGPELACAGSGDVLAGLVASMLSSWKPTSVTDVHKVLFKAVQAHSTAGKLADKKVRPVTSPDILKALQRINL